MKNVEWMLKQGMKFSRLAWGYVNGRNIVYYETGEHFEDNTEPQESTKELYSEKSATVKNIILKWLDMEHKEPILTGEERGYLKQVIAPFREAIKYITKFDNRLHFYLSEGGTLLIYSLPQSFEYRGMVEKKDYILEELDL